MSGPAPTTTVPRVSTAHVLLAGGVFGVAIHGVLFRQLKDWHVFYLAGQRVLAGEELYRASEVPMVFKYAPVTAYAFAPFTAFSESTGGAVWLLVSAAALFRSFLLSRRLFAPEASAWIHLPVFLLALGFYKQLALYGQCDAVLLWLALESEARARSSPRLSGGLLALACLFKPPLGLLALGALLARQWRRVLFVGLVGLLALAVPVVSQGAAHALDELRAWHSMLELTTAPMICSSANQGVFSFACPFFTPEDARFTALALAFAAAIVVGLGAGLWLISRLAPASAKSIAPGCIVYLTAVLSPLSWRANLLALLPLLFLLVDAVRRETGARIALALAAPAVSTVLGLVAYDVVGGAAFEELMAMRIIGVLGVGTAMVSLWAQFRLARAVPVAATS